MSIYPIHEVSLEKIKELILAISKKLFNFEILSSSEDSQSVENILITFLHKDVQKAGLIHFHHHPNETKDKIILRVQHIIKSHSSIGDFFFVSSAFLTPNDWSELKEIFSSASPPYVSFFCSNDINKVLQTDNRIAEQFFPFQAKVTDIIRNLATTIAAAVVTVIISTSFTYFYKPAINKEAINAKILNVENALNGIKGLEKFLEEVKVDLAETQKETIKIKDDFEKASKLRKYSEDDIQFFKAAITRETWVDWFFRNLGSFCLGVISSLAATIAYLKFWK